MTDLIFAVVLILVWVSGFSLGTLLGILRERSKRIADHEAIIAESAASNKAYQNRLLERQGSPPVFKENGDIVLNPSDLPFKAQILRPPFAQAEIDWEEEDEDNRPISFADLDEAEKERIRNTYKP